MWDIVHDGVLLKLSSLFVVGENAVSAGCGHAYSVLLHNRERERVVIMEVDGGGVWPPHLRLLLVVVEGRDNVAGLGRELGIGDETGTIWCHYLLQCS